MFSASIQKYSSVLFAVALIMAALRCQRPPSKDPGKQTTSPPQAGDASAPSWATQSLLRYRNNPPDSMRMDSNEASLGIHKFEGGYFAYVTLADSLVMLYEKVDTGWISIDTSQLICYPHQISITDLNGDRFTDLSFQCRFDAYGNVFSTVYLQDTLQNILLRNKNYDLLNLSYDTSRKALKSRRFGGAASEQYKELLHPQGDSLLLIRGVRTVPDGQKLQLIFYNERGTVKTLSSTTADGNSKLWKLYEASIWADE